LSAAHHEGHGLMVTRSSPWRRAALIHLPMLLIAVFALGPYLWMALTSLTPPDDIVGRGVAVDPSAWTSASYERLFGRTSFLLNMGHSLIVATILFLLVQKRLIGGLTQGAVKG